MRRLLLLRHSKSDLAKPGQPDRDRALNARGRADAPVMGTYLERHGLIPDLALISTSARTRETWALIAPHLTRTPKVRFEDRLYAASPQGILDVIREAPRQAFCLLVVGHNPGLQALAITLAGTGDIETRQHMTEKFSTSALAVISFAAADWTGAHAHGGRLDRFVSPRSLMGEPD